MYYMHFVSFFYALNALEQFQAHEHELEISQMIYQSSRVCHGAVMSANFTKLTLISKEENHTYIEIYTLIAL